MNGRQDDPDGPPVTFSRRSLYLACDRCGSMVWPGDEEAHRRHHAALTRALEDATRR